MQAAMSHFATPDFWYCYRHLPAAVRELADKNFALLRHNPHHPSLRLKKSARSGRHVWGCTTVSWRATGRKDWFGSGLVRTESTISC